MDNVFDCNICDKDFSTWSNLCRHKAVHETDLRCLCEHCNYICNRKDNLKRHIERCHISNGHIQSSNSGQLEETTDSSIIQPKQPQETRQPGNAFEFDQRLQLPNNFVYAGSTQSGKTTLLMKTFENASEIYNPVPSKVVFLYACWQKIYDQLRETLRNQGIKIEYKQEGIINREDLEAMADPNGGQTMIVIDDNSTTVSENRDVVDAFTKARHNNCSIVLLLHFIFGSQNLSKIRGNTGYYFILKSCENAQQVALLGNKMGLKSALVRAYEQESRKPFGYVLIDRRTITPYQHRIRRNIFEELLSKPLVPENKEEQVQTEELRKSETPEKLEPNVEKKQKTWLKWSNSKPRQNRKSISKKIDKKKKTKKIPKEAKRKPRKELRSNTFIVRNNSNKFTPSMFL